MSRAIVVLTVLFAAVVVAESPDPQVTVTLAPRGASQPTQNPRLMTVRGRAVAADNGMRLRRVRILVAVGPRVMAPVFTDDDGRFVVEIPESDAFVVTASKAGYAAAQADVRPTAVRGTVQVRLSRGAAVSGRITDTSGAPLAEQRVSVRRIEALPQGRMTFVDPAAVRAFLSPARFSAAITDDRGEYRVGGLPAGHYEVTARGSAFRAVSGGSVSVSATPGAAAGLPPVPDPSVDVTLSAGQESTIDFTFPADVNRAPMTRRVYALGGATRLVVPSGSDDVRAVEGTIVDEHGEPLQGIGVQVLHLRRQGGRLVAGRLGPPRETDDRGRYRIFGLPSGRYLLMATPDAEMADPTEQRQTVAGYAPVFHPGTPYIDQAVPVSLETGDATGVGLVLAPATLASVTGVALDADGKPQKGTIRLLAAAGSSPIVLESPPIRLDPQGAFVVPNVLPGRYVIQAQGQRGFGAAAEFGIAYIDVAGRNPPPVTIRTSPGATFEGRFVSEGDDPLPAFSAAAVPIDPDRRPAGESETRLVVSTTGSFYGVGLHGPMAIALRGAPDEWFIRSIRVGGAIADGAVDFGQGRRDIANAEIVLSPRAASVAGRVTDERGGVPAARTTVVVFPTFRDEWAPHSPRMKAGAVGGDGTFRIAGLPPGDYWVAAVPGLDPSIDEWQSADVLEPVVSRAQCVTLEEGSMQTLAIK